MSEISGFDVLRAAADDTAADLQTSVQRVREYMDFMTEDLKENGADSKFQYRGDMLDSLVEIWQGIAAIDALNEARQRVETFERGGSC